MSVQPRDETSAELAELAAIRRREPTDPQHIAGSEQKENTVLNEEWRKPSRSNNNGACVEVRLLDGNVNVRDTKDQGNGPVLTFLPEEWDAFITGAQDGEFGIS